MRPPAAAPAPAGRGWGHRLSNRAGRRHKPASGTPPGRSGSRRDSVDDHPERPGESRIDSLEAAVARSASWPDRLGGYSANSQMQAGANQLRSATIEIKVPAARFDDLTRARADWPGGIRQRHRRGRRGRVHRHHGTGGPMRTGSRPADRTAGDPVPASCRTFSKSSGLPVCGKQIERMEGRLRYLKAMSSSAPEASRSTKRHPSCANGAARA